MEENNEKISKSKILITNQNTLSLCGITKVVASTENEICVMIGNQTLSVTGEKLTTTKMDIESGILEATGLVSGLKFAGQKHKENFFKRVFK